MPKLILAFLFFASISTVPVGEENEDSNLPSKFESIDMNNDQVIQAREVNNAIERLITGDPRLNCQMIDELINYYFEQ